MRVLYIGIFTFAGSWALFMVNSYVAEMEIIFGNPVGRGEIQVLGGMYLLSAVAVLYCWIKGLIFDLFKITTFVMGAVLLSRIYSYIQGDFNDMIHGLTLSEVPLFVWSVWGLRKYGGERD